MNTKTNIKLFLFSICLILIFSSNVFSNQVEYKKISFENITLFSADKDQKVARNIALQLDKDIQVFQKRIGTYLDGPIRVVIAPDREEYSKWVGKHSKIMEFSLAFYNNRNQTIYIKNPRVLKSLSALRRILLHEYIHHFVNSFWKNPPLWFNEGMAVYFSEDMGIDREFNFAKNYILGNSRPLEMMKYGYPKNRIEWESFYAKSGLAVKYLYKQRRQEFYKFWDYALPERNFDSAFLKSFFFTPKDFSLFFEEYSKTHFRMEILLASTGIIWGILPLVLIIGVIRKKIKSKKIKTQWEEETEDLLESE